MDSHLPSFAPLMPMVRAEMPHIATAGESVVGSLMDEVRRFERALSSAEELLLAVDSGTGLILESVKHAGPVIVFVGRDATGRPVRLIQHASRLNVVLTARPRADQSEPRRPIGFSSVDPGAEAPPPAG